MNLTHALNTMYTRLEYYVLMSSAKPGYKHGHQKSPVGESKIGRVSYPKKLYKAYRWARMEAEFILCEYWPARKQPYSK